jgi:hypothetical protein
MPRVSSRAIRRKDSVVVGRVRRVHRAGSAGSVRALASRAAFIVGRNSFTFLATPVRSQVSSERHPPIPVEQQVDSLPSR